MSNLNTSTITELKGLIRAGKLRSFDVLGDIHKAIEEDASHELPLNTYTSFDMTLIARAVEESGVEKGALQGTVIGGVPIAVKDLINVRGGFTTCGSNILREYRSPYDATAVVYMKKNGGIPAGKLNMDEFAMGSSNENTAFGLVRNPHNRSRIPGGSSGGAASAVAAHLAVAALASDTGGSIRQPASMCGVFGLAHLRESVQIRTRGVCFVTRPDRSDHEDRVGWGASTAGNFRT